MTWSLLCRTERCKDVVDKAVFGFGCCFEEHAKYGMCLDGMCGRRAEWEDVSHRGGL